MANIHNLDTLAYDISSPESKTGKKTEDLLNSIKQNSLQDSLSHFIENAGFVFELKNTTVSIQPNSNPSFFSIPINRTQYVDGQGRKNDKAIKFNDTFTISQKEFKLTDIIMHGGESSESGHYYTISKREIELTNGQKHSVFLQHDDDKTICFMKFGNEIQFIDIKDVESKLKTYNESLELSENSSFKFATLADIKESQKIEQNFANIIYQKEIPFSKIDNTYKGLENYGNSCYINSFLAVVAGMNDGSEKQLLLTQLKANGIELELVNNKFSSIDEKTDIKDLVGILRINKDENRIAIHDGNNKNEDKSGQTKIPENQKAKIFDQTKNSETKNKTEEKPKTTIEPSFFSKMCDFFASLNPFSCCKGN